jgi:hypothetical protein
MTTIEMWPDIYTYATVYQVNECLRVEVLQSEMVSVASFSNLVVQKLIPLVGMAMPVHDERMREEADGLLPDRRQADQRRRHR